MAKTKFVQLRGFAEWAKVFPENRDMESTNKGVNKMLKECEGQYKVNFYPADEEELAKAKSCGLSLGLYGGGQRFKQTGNYGAGEYFELKAKHKDVKETKDGEVNFGGPPEIVHWNEDRRNDPWIKDQDGWIGNGAEVVVKFSIYGEDTGQTVRLLKIGVVNNVEYNSGERL